MAAGNVNLLMGCEDCRFADTYGRGCEHGLMFPVLLLMAGQRDCPNFKNKTREQLEIKYNLK